MLRLHTSLAPRAFWHKVHRPVFAVTALAGCFGGLLLSAHQTSARPETSGPIVVRAPKLTPHQINAQRRQASHPSQNQAHLAKITAQNQALTSGNIVEAAYAFRGTRYVMGGTSRSGFDCSGFVRYILSATGGVALPRTATEQYYNGAPIPSNQLQPGDLVFFKNTYKHGISHVGIYAGEGKFIHAANAHKGVRMDNLGDSYYQAHYAGARRVLPEQMRTVASLR